MGKIMVFQKDIKDGAYPVRMTLVGWAGIMIFLITEMVTVERPPAVVSKHRDTGHEGRCQADAGGDDGASRFECTVFCQGKHRDAGTCQWNVPTVLPACKSLRKREGGRPGREIFASVLGRVGPDFAIASSFAEVSASDEATADKSADTPSPANTLEGAP